MLIHVHGTCRPAVRITARDIVPHSSRARCKPHIERVEEDAVRIVWVHGDSLVVPVLGIIACGIRAVSERAALRTFHVSPARATVCGSPGTQLAAIGAAADGCKARAAARTHGGTVQAVCTVVAQIVLDSRGKPSGADRGDDPSRATHIA